MLSTEHVIIIFIGGLIMIFVVCFCRLFRSRVRSQERARRTSLSTQQTALRSTSNTRRNSLLDALRDDMPERNHNTTGGEAIQSPQNESQEDDIRDPIAESGPPTYEETQEPQLPPPSYEEALRLSMEDLSATQEQQAEHFV